MPPPPQTPRRCSTVSASQTQRDTHSSPAVDRREPSHRDRLTLTIVVTVAHPDPTETVSIDVASLPTMAEMSRDVVPTPTSSPTDEGCPMAENSLPATSGTDLDTSAIALKSGLAGAAGAVLAAIIIASAVYLVRRWNKTRTDALTPRRNEREQSSKPTSPSPDSVTPFDLDISDFGDLIERKFPARPPTYCTVEPPSFHISLPAPVTTKQRPLSTPALRAPPRRLSAPIDLDAEFPRRVSWYA
ncbi:hypothetical protein C8Q79DRAFT_1014257 [Trametes meyenii]|nr:hypothetical protein C8Q79DRAFT_1014257 [Trametes meyenii]